MQKKLQLGRSTTAWVLFILLCIIWGSSFVLMKIGMETLSPYQVASIRIASAGIVLLPFSVKAFKQTSFKQVPLILLSGLLGSFFPAYLYCMAETHIDSSAAAIFNSLTPLFSIIVGIVFFKMRTGLQKIMGALLGFIGMVLLPFSAGNAVDFSHISYSSLVILATICYAVNVNLVSKYLKDVLPLSIAAIAFGVLLMPSLIILTATGFFTLPLLQEGYLKSVGAATVLGIAGTAIASVLFYRVVKLAGVIFASLVTYGIPVIAVILGVLYGEKITLAEGGCLAIILLGVYIANRKK